MKIYSILLIAAIFCGCAKDNDNPITNPTPTVYEPNGAWVYTGSAVSYNPGTCGLPSNPFTSLSGTFLVARVGSDISATSSGVTYTGTFANNVINMTATYNNNGWIETDIVEFGLSSNTSGTGTLSWSLAAGGLACSGTDSLTGIKQ